MSEANKSIVRRYREIHNNNEMDSLNEVLAPDFVPHTFARHAVEWTAVSQAGPLAGQSLLPRHESDH